MIRVALIGYGYAGRTFHAPLLRSTPGIELVAVTTSRGEAVRHDLPGVAVTASAEDACALPSVDLIVVATPSDAHVGIAAMAMRAGKHVVVEKPFAPTLDEARELAAIADGTDRVLAGFQNRRWDGDFVAVADLVARGALGEIAHFESHFDRYRPAVRDRWRERAGVGSGLWYDLGPHLVDQALQLFGLPDLVWADLAAQRAGAQSDDWAHAVLHYGRMRVILHTSVLVPSPAVRFVVHGTMASWRKYGLDSQERDLVASLTPPQAAPAVAAEHAVLIDGATGTETVTPIPRGNYGQFYAQVRDAILGTGPNPVPPAQAVAVTAVVETAIRSSAEKRALPVPLTAAEVLATRRASATVNRT
jgi:predicted dehydrogenase